MNPKRSNAKAREIPDWPEPVREDATFHGQPGDMIRSRKADESLYGFLIACPGCGQFGAIAVHPESPVKWTVTGGSLDDVTTLSLSPSILKHCCGWHGFLTNGVFESC